MNQITDTILMIRPVAYRMNEQTAVNNYFMEDTEKTEKEVTRLAQAEFDEFVKKLRAVGVKVIVVEDRKEMDTPDSVFPNNWVSFHQNGTVGLYPMFAENRRRERREDVFERIEEEGFLILNFMDYTGAEEEGKFLEATGSLLLDRQHRKAYCALSPRADEDLVLEFCEDFEYMPIIFQAYQTVNGERKEIYHTNVMMGLGEELAVICLDSIDDSRERKMVIKSLKEDGKVILKLSAEQMHHFAGNMLEVRGAVGKKYMVMSQAAYDSLREDQIKQIEKYSGIIKSDIHIIEKLGGGSVRCMMAEIFLPKR